MYFDYLSTTSQHWEGGHCVMGATQLSTQFYFAEGTTRSGFESWLTLQNPHDHDITVNAVYQLGQGQGVPRERSYGVKAGSRRTVFVADEVGKEKDVSVALNSDQTFLAERPIYFAYAYAGLAAKGGHCVVGAFTPAQEWLLAEGYTGSGFQQWLCLQNPGEASASVEVTYYTQEAGTLPAEDGRSPGAYPDHPHGQRPCRPRLPAIHARAGRVRAGYRGGEAHVFRVRGRLGRRALRRWVCSRAVRCSGSSAQSARASR